MIKAVIFDCFGVLTTDGWLPFKKKYFGDNSELFEEAGRLNVLADSGKIPANEFARLVAELAKIPAEQAVSEIWNSVTNTELFDFISSELVSKYKIGMLSNASGNFLEDLFTESQIELFNPISLSCDTGYVKPQEGAYNSIIDAIGLDVEDCVFIDDQPRYIEGARRIGLKSILYQDFEQMKDELVQLLKVTDTNK